MTVTPQLETDAVRLSTQPEPVGPRTSRQLLAPARRAWRQLTSMRTALVLLFLLALGAVPGGFLPQRSLNPVRVDEYLRQHPTLAPILDRLSLFDVFAAPWFAAVYLLLFVSLVGCLVPRIRLHARAMRKPPPQAPGNLSRLPASAHWETRLSVDEVLASATRQLRGWRTVRHADAVGAERGYLRETGNLLFHCSLVALLIGIAVGQFFGFKGTVLVKEGDGFANAIANYDDIHPGRRFRQDSLVPLHFTLDDFRATYGADGKARTFDAKVRYAASPDAAETPYDIRVNHPLHVGAAKVYLIGHGYNVHVVVRDKDGQIALDASQATPCLPQDARFLSSCTIKVPDTRGPQLGFEGAFTPTTYQNPVTHRVASAHPAVQNPGLTIVGYSGDLGLDVGPPQSVYSLDKTHLTPLDNGRPHLLGPGETWKLPGGGSITFADVTEWSTFQVTQDPGKGIALGAAVGIVAGLCLSLFVRRRRLWVRARPGEGAHTVVEVGGLARTDAEAFAAEFDEIVGSLRREIPAPSAPTSSSKTE
ncbi:MAG: cytochrome c biosis protein [Actinomycetota bacterium]|jgi:cytochrome c biogenesis protein|nr:cytochrome c biosis protein [Actinomycetota bacterium]